MNDDQGSKPDPRRFTIDTGDRYFPPTAVRLSNSCVLIETSCLQRIQNARIRRSFGCALGRTTELMARICAVVVRTRSLKVCTLSKRDVVVFVFVRAEEVFFNVDSFRPFV